MATRSSILILVAIDQRDSLEHTLKLLAEDKLPCPPAPFTSIRVEEARLASVETRIRRRRRGSRDSGVVLISDGLVDEHDFQHPTTNAARNLLDEFGDTLLTMIAVMHKPARVVDIERSVSQQPDAAELGNALARCLRKLAYLRKPATVRKIDPRRYVYRILRFEHELLEYFQLRRDVYSVMCYLDADAERAPSGMEIDWFDKSSVHVGVFYKESGFERLVGTGRLIATARIRGTVPDEVCRVAALDPVLCAALEQAVGLQLPVLQSHALVELAGRILDLRVVAGEISRVIVVPEHRGSGLSTKITDCLIRLAEGAGMSDLLLECLPIHTGVYRKCGFRLIPNASGRVYKIGRTMDVMARAVAEPSIFPDGSFGQPAGAHSHH